MFDFTEAKIETLIIHQVGNKLKDEPLVLSESTVNVTENSLTNLIERYFFQRFKNNAHYSFGHETDLAFNEIYQYSKNIFCDYQSLVPNSKNIAMKLYKVSTHPNIKSGELHIAYIKNAMLNDRYCDAIGIFKSETKAPFLKISTAEEQVTLGWDTGIDIGALDKGCIIFNDNEYAGYNVLIVDAGNVTDTKYWAEDFLGITKNDCSFHKAKVVVEACKQYLKKDFRGDTAEKVTALNNVISYISSNESLDLDEFSVEVVEQEDEARQLKEYIQVFAEKKNFRDIQSFPVEPLTAKSIKTSIKNVIRLDASFEIKVKSVSKSDQKRIEKGYDNDKKMNYYKIYFNEET